MRPVAKNCVSIAYGFLGAGLFWTVAQGRPAIAQVTGSIPSYFKLQSTTPGTIQTGNGNISGTFIAGQHVGGGAGLTGVNADLLDGINSSAFLQAVPNPLILTSATAFNPTIKATNTSNSSNATGVYGEATGSTASVKGVWGKTTGTNGQGVYGSASGNSSSGGYFENFNTFGVGATAVAESYGLEARATGSDAISWAVKGDAESTSGIFESYGVYGSCMNERGAGVYGVNRSSTINGYNAAGVRGTSTNPSGFGVFGIGAYAVAGDGDILGGYFWSSNGTGSGVFGYNYSSSGEAIGGEFGTNSSSGRGIFSTAGANSGTTYAGRFECDSGDGRALYALATATGASDNPYGVRGQCSTATTGYGVYAVGDLGASGVKSFRIDHPADPENKYLLHYSSESPFPQNFYSGNVTTNAQGYAWVNLPDYFASINANFKYQLTVMGKTFAQAIVSEEIQGNRFQVHTNQPNIKVSWRIEADRNDLRVQYNRPTDVRQKSASEKGLYQHPEYYNRAASLSMDFDPKPKKGPRQAPRTRAIK